MAPEQTEPTGAVTFTIAPMGEQEPDRPLLLIPLPVDARLFTSVMLTVCDWWEQQHGTGLAFGPQCGQETTPYGLALVLRDRAVAGVDGGDADSPPSTSEDPAAAPTTEIDNTAGGG